MIGSNRKDSTNAGSAVPSLSEEGRFAVASLPLDSGRTQPVIFLVDDEKPFTDLMGALLEHALGLRISVHNDPRSALHALNEDRPKLIISDYRMPGLDGFEFLREAAAMQPEVPSILVTGNALDAETIGRRKPPRLLHVLFKPLSWRDIAAVMREHALLP